jgi:excisionase family DNA binding protein
MTTTAPAWISVARAARRFALSDRHIWRLVAAGRIESRRDGPRRLISVESLASLAAKKNTDIEAKCQCFCQSDMGQDRIVDELIERLRPTIAALVREHFANKGER